MTNEQKTDESEGAKVPAAPYASAEIWGALFRPYKAIDVILAQRDRWTSTVADRRDLGALLALMFVVSGLFALPYGLVLGIDQFWHVVALFLGSTLICFPSFHVFSAFLSLRVNLSQNLALALLVTSVSAIFSFGFFPIFWFLRITMSDGESSGTLHGLSVFLLIAALAVGLIQLCRCLFRERRIRPVGSFWFWVILLHWQALVVFITYRMGLFLGLI